MCGSTRTFWDLPTFHEYERLCGDEPSTRSRLLADATWQTRVVDLSVSEVELWRGVRRSYHALIHKAERECEITVIDGTSEDESRAGVECAMRLHRLVSKRQTRTYETWNQQFLWLLNEQALLVCVHFNKIEEGFVYVVRYGAWSYYFSSATHRDNVNHALLWHAMKALKARGVRYLELGWMAREGDTAKDVGISHFKAGMGGYDIPAKEAPELCAP